MDLTSGLFVGALVIVGGIAGYSADVIGRNIGKKRLHIRRMRPRHTAAFASAVAGALIPLASVFVLYGLSSDVRIWLQEGRRAIGERDKALYEKIEAQRQLSGVVRSLNEKSSEINTLNRQYNELSSKKTQTETKLAAARADYDQANRKYNEIHRKLDGTQTEYRVLQTTYTTLKSTFGGLSAQYKVIEQKMHDSERHGIELDLQLQSQRRELDAKKKEVEKIEDQRTLLESELTTLQLQSASASKLFEDQIRQQASLLETEKLKLDQAKSERIELEKQNNVLREGFVAARQLPMIFARGDELSRAFAPTGLTQEASRSALLSVLRSARAIALEREAAPPPGGSEVSGLFDQRIDGELVTAKMQEDMAVAAIAKAQQPVVIIARSLWNAFKGEFVPLIINVVPNPIVYERGQRVLEARIDGGVSEGEIINQITEFMQGPLTTKALEDGMIPAVGKDSPLGVITRDAILAVTREVANSHRVVRVGAYALDTIRAGDPLRLEFRVR